MKKMFRIIIMLLFVILFGIIGKQDMNNQEIESQHYISTYGVDYTQM